MVPERRDGVLDGSRGEGGERRKRKDAELMQVAKTSFQQYFSEHCSCLEVWEKAFLIKPF